MDTTFKKIVEQLDAIETHEKKVLIVPKEYKTTYKAFFTEYLINPGTSIPDSTVITSQNGEINIKNGSLFFYGLYVKEKRNVSQTPMPGVEHAVSDICKEFCSFFHSDDFKFVAAGREDTDVLNINGRPFYVEMINPKRNLTKEIPHSLLQNHFVTLIDIVRVKGDKIKKFILEGERSHHKIYSLYAKCYKQANLIDLIQNKTDPANIDSYILEPFVFKEIKIEQKTPLRVLHRRANMVRNRTIEILDYNIDRDIVYLYLRSSAGTYIKEFVSGNFNRTTPSLSSILQCHCHCTQLDVEEIENSTLPSECKF